jgi:hypothetical protein
MKSLNLWFHQQLDQKLVEPNSDLGQAIRYMIKHWDTLTLFLKVPNVPLDNNLCEQALKKLSCIAKIPCFTELGMVPGSVICL